jgi:hypothetical protein
MRFQLDAGFNVKKLEVTVTYLDKGTGSWSIGLPGMDGIKIFQNKNSGEWKTQTLTSSGFSDLVLNYESGDDTTFHLIEVNRID